MAEGAKEKAEFFSMHIGYFRCKFSKSKLLYLFRDLGVSQEGKESSPCGPSTTRGHLKDIRSIGTDLLWSAKGHTFCMTHCTKVGNK